MGKNTELRFLTSELSQTLFPISLSLQSSMRLIARSSHKCSVRTQASKRQKRWKNWAFTQLQSKEWAGLPRTIPSQISKCTSAFQSYQQSFQKEHWAKQQKSTYTWWPHLHPLRKTKIWFEAIHWRRPEKVCTCLNWWCKWWLISRKSSEVLSSLQFGWFLYGFRVNSIGTAGSWFMIQLRSFRVRIVTCLILPCLWVWWTWLRKGRKKSIWCKRLQIRKRELPNVCQIVHKTLRWAGCWVRFQFKEKW